jgi:hypothetical protein
MRVRGWVAVLCASACSGGMAVPDAGGRDAGMDAGVDAGVDAGMDSGVPDAGNLDHGAPSTTYPAYAIDWPQLIGSDAGIIAQPRAVAVTYDGDTLRSDVETMISNLGATPYWQTTTSEYGVSRLSALAPIHLNETAPTLFDDNDIQTFITTHLNAADAGWPMPDGQTIYALYFPATTQVTLGGMHSCQTFGAYHSSYRLNGVKVAYAVMPRCPGAPSVPLIATDLQLLTGVTSHELIEAVTDIDGTGYSLPPPSHIAFATFAGAETGDMCEFNSGAWILDPDLNVTVQRTWSNQAALAGHEPCVPAPSQTSTYAVPVFTEMVPITFSGAALMTPGVSLGMGESATVPLLLVSSGPTQPFTVTAIDRMQFDNLGQSLRFDFDRNSGVNGEKIYLTITRVGDDPNFGGAMPFLIQGSVNGSSSSWFAVVGAKN